MPDKIPTQQKKTMTTTTKGLIPTAVTHLLAVMSLMVPGMTILPANLLRKETKIHPAIRTPVKGLGLPTHTKAKAKNANAPITLKVATFPSGVEVLVRNSAAIR